MSDKEIILGCLQHDSNYQKLLFDKYSGVLFTICRRYFKDPGLAEDALQEGYIRIFHKLEQFKFEGSFEGWLKRIMVNVCLRKLQGELKQYNWTDLDQAVGQSVKPTAVAVIGEEDLMALIAQLPAGYRTVFNMYAIDGYSHSEIAERLGITDSTSRSQLVKARKMLQKLLEELYGEGFR